MIRDVNSVVQFSNGTSLPKYDTDTVLLQVASCDGPFSLSFAGLSFIICCFAIFSIFMLRYGSQQLLQPVDARSLFHRVYLQLL